MVEWVLVVALTIASEQGTVRDPSLSIVDGFSSRQACEEAGARIASTVVVTIGDLRKSQGIDPSKPGQHASVWPKCVSIKK